MCVLLIFLAVPLVGLFKSMIVTFPGHTRTHMCRKDRERLDKMLIMPILLLKGFLGGASFVDHLCYLCLVFVMFSCLSIAALRSPTWKGLTT